MDQNEEQDIFNVDIARTALSYNANLVVVYNHKKMLFCYEHLQKMMEKFQGKVLNLPLFCAIVSEQGEPCKNENASNSLEFVARTVTKGEALGDF